MKGMTEEQLTFAADAKNEGHSWDEVYVLTQEEFGLEALPTYSQCWLFWARREMDPSEYIEGDDAEVAKAIAKARDQENESWGYIAVRCNKPESRVRKLYEEKTNVRSEGQRIAHGGRYLGDDEAYYADEEQRARGNRFVAGVPIPDPSSLGGVAALASLPSAELKAKAKELGVKASGSKMVIAGRIAQAMKDGASEEVAA